MAKSRKYDRKPRERKENHPGKRKAGEIKITVHVEGMRQISKRGKK